MRRVLAIVLVLLIAGPAFGQGSGPYRNYTFDTSGYSNIGYPCPSVDPNCVHSCWNFEAPIDAYTDDCKGLYTMALNGAPTLLTGDGTWPNGLSGTAGKSWSFDGAADYLSRNDDGSFDMDLTNNPGGDFSVQCVVRSDTVAAGPVDAIISKYRTGDNERGWAIERSTANVTAYVSSNGTNFSSCSVVNALAPYRPSFITFAYQYVGAANSVGNLYIDNLATVTNNAMVGPVHDSASPFVIGDRGDLAGNRWDGLISDCKIYKGIVITEAQHDQMFAQWQGRLSTGGVPVSISSASPPAYPLLDCSSNDRCLVDQPANSGYIGIQGLHAPSAISNLFRRSYFRSWDGAHGTCGDCPTGLSCACAAGDGTAAIDPDGTTQAVDTYSAKITLTGTTSYSMLFSTCRTGEIGENLRMEIYYKCAAGTCSSLIRLREFTAAANCTGAYAETDLVTPSGSSWGNHEGTFAAGSWNGATQSFQLYLLESGNGGVTSNWSAPQLRSSAAAIPLSIDAFCGNDEDTDVACTDVIPSTPSPLSANGAMTVVMTVRSPWAGTDLAASVWFFTDGNAAAANTYGIYLAQSSDEPVWLVADNAAAQRTIAPNVLNWTANTNYTIKVRTGGNNDLGLYWNSVWNITAAGAGTGMRSAAQSTTYIGSSQTAPADVWIRDLKFYRRKTP